MPPANEGFIKSIHPFKVSFPHTHIATANAFPGKFARYATLSIGQAQQVRELAGMTKHTLPEPEKPGATIYLLGTGQHALRQFRRQQNPAPVDKKSGFGKCLVLRNKVMLRHTITIQKNDIRAACQGHTTVTNACGGKTNIRMPDMHQLERLGVGRFNDGPYMLLAGAIVGNNHLKMLITLTRQTI